MVPAQFKGPCTLHRQEKAKRNRIQNSETLKQEKTNPRILKMRYFSQRDGQARFEARLKLAELPRNSSAGRLRNRCEVSGRPRAFTRKMKMSRIALREMGSKGLIPGLVKSSW